MPIDIQESVLLHTPLRHPAAPPSRLSTADSMKKGISQVTMNYTPLRLQQLVLSSNVTVDRGMNYACAALRPDYINAIYLID